VTVSFARYAALVKNLRGVVLADLSEEGVEEHVGWLTRRFRYRNLGLVPWVVERYRGRLEGRLGGRPFRELYAPVGAVVRVAELLEGSLGLSRGVAELLAFASAYISPGILLGRRFLGELERLAVDRVLACKGMDLRSWKLHLRIADYSALDFYEGSVEEALAVIEGRLDPQAAVRARRERVGRDKRRFWRISCGEGEPLLLYVDNLELALRGGFLRALEPDACPALAIVPVVYVNPALLP